ncbi:MAG TPA: S9 family peptidase [Vicinamibacteria bacterium]|nr:S9 family peptidase [Vicinamibacteria bacterium]
MPKRLRAVIAAASLALVAPSAAGAQPQTLTLDDIYHPDRKVDFDGAPPRDLAWIDDAHYLWPRKAAGEEVEFLKVEALTGRTVPLYDPARVEKTLGTLDGATPEDARRAARQRTQTFNGSRTALVLEVAGDLYYYDLAGHRVRRLTRAKGREEEPAVSPDGARVAFVRDHDLYVVDVAGGAERRLTTDGSANVLNGKLDWVYQEEIYGRGKFRAHWWSPDSRRLAFLRLDETAVPRYTVLDEIPRHGEVQTYPYPKAGDPNPKVSVGVVAVSGGATVWADTRAYGDEILVVGVGFTPESDQLVLEVQDREQTWLDLNLADAATGALRRVLRETTRAWVEPQGGPRWLPDGGFLWLSERTGWKHLYRYARDGGGGRAVTSGSWEVRELYGVDARGGWAYFSATERNPLAPDLYRVKLDGGAVQRLSAAPGTHSALFNPSFSLYADTRSDLTTPPQVRLFRADGTLARVIDDNPVPALARYRLAEPERVQVPTRDGFLMDAILIKPPDFDPSRKYPVYQHTYGGPHAPQVKDAWGGTGYMFHQLLAQRGIVVWICDNRSASGKGAQSAWPAYKRLGELELQDVEDGLDWLARQGWVDTARIGIGGWSYGGLMVTYALTHSDRFAMGIAGAPVTDWHNYDTVYTERYMLTPARNPDGYRRTSSVLAADRLRGRLLLMHGSVDDNVHVQNSLQFAHALQKAGKPFEFMVYPRSRHAVSDPHLVAHLRATMLSFIEETLLGGLRATEYETPPPPASRPAPAAPR